MILTLHFYSFALTNGMDEHPRQFCALWCCSGGWPGAAWRYQWWLIGSCLLVVADCLEGGGRVRGRVWIFLKRLGFVLDFFGMGLSPLWWVKFLFLCLIVRFRLLAIWYYRLYLYNIWIFRPLGVMNFDYIGVNVILLIWMYLPNFGLKFFLSLIKCYFCGSQKKNLHSLFCLLFMQDY